MNNTHNLDMFDHPVKPDYLSEKQRMKAFYDHSSPAKLVRSRSAYELLLSIKEIGIEDCLELIELLSPKQVQGILDLEIWRNYSVDLKKAGHYFSMLLSANIEKALAQIHGQDIEFIGLLFKQVAKIYDISEGEEPEEDPVLMSLSPDGRFAVCFDEIDDNKDLARAMHTYLEHLYGFDMKYALGLLERVRFEMVSGLEEESLRFRTARLMDMGILPHEERLEYFADLNIKQLRPQKINQAFSSPKHSLSLLPLLELPSNKYIFMNKALEACSDEEKAVFHQQLSHAALNIFASLSGDFGNKEELFKVCRYISTLCEFGVAHQSLGQMALAHHALKVCSAKELIRLGRTVLSNMRKKLKAKKALGHYLFGLDFCLADSPLREVARALCLPEPRFYEGLLDSKKLEVRFFDSLGELSSTIEAIEELSFRALLVGPNILGADEKMLKDHSQLSHAGIYARYLLNNFLGNKNTLAVIKLEDRANIFTAPEKLGQELVSYSKIFAQDLAQDLTKLYPEYPQDLAAQKCTNFNTAVLISLEQNYEMLLGG